MSKSFKKELKICKKYQTKAAQFDSTAGPLNADQIFQTMIQMKRGLSMTSNPTKFANKIITSQDPLIRLRQNANNEAEVVDSLPISKINVLNSSISDEIRHFTMAYMPKLPESDIAFIETQVARVVDTKKFQDRSMDEYAYSIIVSDFSPETKFAVNPTQVGKWFPGMYTVYSDGL